MDSKKQARLDRVRKASNSIHIVYHPRGVQRDIFEMHDEEILLAGPAGTGKSLGALQKVHAVLSKYSGSKGFMSRKTRTSMTNSCMATYETHVIKPQDKVKLHKQDQVYNYPNGSKLALIGLDDPERIKSTEWDIGYIQEATECLENDWEMCTSRLRNWVVPYQQLLGDCNPDKPSHWLKKRADAGKTIMLNSKHEDNPKLWNAIAGEWTKEGKVYLGKLDRLTGHRRSRLKMGLWVAAEGVVYETWDPLVHMISKVDLPKGWEEWTHYWAIDWGHIHPFVWQDWIENPNTGQLYRLQEIYCTKVLVEDNARRIKALTKDWYVPRAIICDHDAEDRAVFERHTSLLTLPAYKSIRIGVEAVTNRLDPNWCDNGPGLLYVRDGLIEVDKAIKEDGLPTCTEEEYDGYVWDEKLARIVNSKKDELPLDKDNHGMDATRYITAFVDDLAIDPEEFEGVVELGEGITISRY